MKLFYSVILPVCCLFAAPLIGLRANTISFEGLTDSTILTTQYSGVTFSNTIILTSGISLDEIDFPPHSGVNVVSDNNGPITIDFSSPITSFSGYFTYTEPLTLDGFDASSDLVASATSAFPENFVSSGNPPNELLELTSLTGISSVTITGDPLGSSFTLDDLSYTSATSAVPEPNNLLLVVMATGAIYIRRKFL